MQEIKLYVVVPLPFPRPGVSRLYSDNYFSGLTTIGIPG